MTSSHHTQSRLLLLMIVVCALSISVCGRSIKGGATDTETQESKRYGSCGDSEALLFGMNDARICVNVYIFGASLTFGVIGLGFFYGIASNWAQAVVSRANFQDDSKQTKRWDDGISWPDWDNLESRPIYNEDGTYSYTYADISYDIADTSLQNPSAISSYNARYHADGGLLSMNATLPVNSSDMRRDGEEHSVTYSYGSPLGHRKTDLDKTELWNLFRYGFGKLIDNNPDVTGFCGEVDNGGGWEGYLAIAVDGQWDDCWMYIQKHI